jgi:hypothetical protein
MSTKSNLRAFGAAFTAGAKGIEKIGETERAERHLKVQEDLATREVMNKENITKIQKTLEERRISLESQRVSIEEMKADLLKEANTRENEKHTYVLPALYAGYMYVNAQTKELGLQAQKLQQEYDAFGKPTEKDKWMFETAKAMALINQKGEFIFSGLTASTNAAFQSREQAHEYALKVTERAADMVSLPTGTGSAAEKARAAHMKKFKDTVKTFYDNSKQDFVAALVNTWGAQQDANIKAAFESITAAAQNPLGSTTPAPTPTPTPTPTPGTGTGTGTPPPPPPPPASDDQIIQTFAAGAAEMGSEDAALAFLKDAARQQGPAAFPYRLLEKAMEQVRKLLSFKYTKEQMKTLEYDEEL